MFDSQVRHNFGESKLHCEMKTCYDNSNLQLGKKLHYKEMRNC